MVKHDHKKYDVSNTETGGLEFKSDGKITRIPIPEKPKKAIRLEISLMPLSSKETGMLGIGFFSQDDRQIGYIAYAVNQSSYNSLCNYCRINFKEIQTNRRTT